MTPWILNDFKPFCERSGIDIMRDDLRFIERILPRIPIDRQRYVLKDYVSIWKTEPMQNMGRRKANEFLRDMVDEHWPTT